MKRQPFRNTKTIPLSAKAYPFDWTRFAVTILGGALLVAWAYVKVTA